MFENVVELINWIESQKRSVPKVSLDRFRKICSIYGNPQDNIKYIHVGGTNGKGSTVSYIKNILRNANYNIGCYISPYVIKFNERISYNDIFIDDETLLEIGNYIISKYNELESNNIEKLSFFEFVTLAAFIYFSRIENLDFVILEVGLGGLLDVTNIITPLVSVITNVNYDHMNVLGNTLVEIAKNKLGIVKEGIPLITIFNPEINILVIDTTNSLNSELILVKKENIEDLHLSIHQTIFTYKEYEKIKLKLLGAHQAENASLALEVVKILREKYNYLITDNDIRSGLANTTWPGRLELVHENPYILVDGAHNIDGVYRLTEFLKSIKGNQKIEIIFAVSADKDKVSMIRMLEEVADEMIFSSFHYKRSDQSIHLLELSEHHNKRVEDDLEKLINSLKTEQNKIIVFCGSLYFVSELLKLLKR